MDITITVGAKKCKIMQKLPQDLFDHLRRKTKYKVHGYQFTPKYQMGVWDGSKVLLYKDQTAPAGMFSRLRNLLEKEGHTVEIDFVRSYKPTGDVEIAGLPHGLDDLQKKAIKRALKARYCIIEAPIRFGKTAIIAGLIKKINHFPAWVVTYGKDVTIQIQEALKEHLGTNVGMFSEGTFVDGDVIVSSYQAMQRLVQDPKSKDKKKLSQKVENRNKKLLEKMKESKVLILDESQYVFSKKSKLFLDRFENVGYKIGLSGTPREKSKISAKEMEAAIGPIALKIPFNSVISDGRLAQPKVILYDLPGNWYQGYLTELPDIYEANIVQNDYRNSFIVRIVTELQKQNKTAFIFVRKKDHGYILQDLIPKAVYVHGGVNTTRRKKLYDRLQNGKIPCIISTVGKVGLNLPKLNAVINAEGYKAHTLTIQKMRSLTAHKDKSCGLVIDFIDKGKYLFEHSEDRVSEYTNLKGFIIKKREIKRDFFERKDNGK